MNITMLQDAETNVNRMLQFFSAWCNFYRGGAAMEPRDPTIGERVMLMRRRRGLNQRTLAAMAQMSPTALNRLENGLQSVYAERIATLARILGVSADYLLGLHEDVQTVQSATNTPEDTHDAKPTRQARRARHAAPVA
jgi:transcriptional regulator with XRE-family HTH domain